MSRGHFYEDNSKKGLMAMSNYELLMVILTMIGIIVNVLIANIKTKK